MGKEDVLKNALEAKISLNANEIREIVVPTVFDSLQITNPLKEDVIFTLNGQDPPAEKSLNVFEPVHVAPAKGVWSSKLRVPKNAKIKLRCSVSGTIYAQGGQF